MVSVSVEPFINLLLKQTLDSVREAVSAWEITSKANCGHWYLHEVELSQLHDPLGTEPLYIAKGTLTEFLLGKEDRPQKASPAVC